MLVLPRDAASTKPEPATTDAVVTVHHDQELPLQYQ
jgi:hypothetical protein